VEIEVTNQTTVAATWQMCAMELVRLEHQFVPVPLE
jgi:hypothetical protein